MKLYKILKQIILEDIANKYPSPVFKTWVSGKNQVLTQIKRLLNFNKDNYIGYFVEIKYQKGDKLTNRWGVLTHLGKSLRNNDMVRIYEQNNDAGTPLKSKTYLIDKIKSLKISKVPLMEIPDDWEDFNPNNDEKMKRVSDIASFGSYQYAASTIKAKERQEKRKEAELAAKGETPAQKQLRQKETQRLAREKTLQQQQPQQQNTNNTDVNVDDNELNNDELNKI
jgi:hypothetical protein